jgi:hypothetical protein
MPLSPNLTGSSWTQNSLWYFSFFISKKLFSNFFFKMRTPPQTYLLLFHLLEHLVSNREYLTEYIALTKIRKVWWTNLAYKHSYCCSVNASHLILKLNRKKINCIKTKVGQMLFLVTSSQVERATLQYEIMRCKPVGFTHMEFCTVHLQFEHVNICGLSIRGSVGFLWPWPCAGSSWLPPLQDI